MRWASCVLYRRRCSAVRIYIYIYNTSTIFAVLRRKGVIISLQRSIFLRRLSVPGDLDALPGRISIATGTIPSVHICRCKSSCKHAQTNSTLPSRVNQFSVGVRIQRGCNPSDEWSILVGGEHCFIASSAASLPRFLLPALARID